MLPLSECLESSWKIFLKVVSDYNNKSHAMLCAREEKNTSFKKIKTNKEK